MQWRVLLFAFACLLSFAPSPATAEPPSNLRVTIKPTKDGIDAHFAFDLPVTKFEFAYPEAKIRAQTWSLSRPELRLAENAIVAPEGQAFSEFDVHVTPLDVRTDATYLCLLRVAEGSYGVYASYFVGDQSVFETTLAFDLPQGAIIRGTPLDQPIWRAERARTDQPANRLIYIGAKTHIRERTNAVYIVQDGVAAWLHAHIEKRTDQSLAYYARRFEQPLNRKPLVFISQVTGKNAGTGYQGDVTQGPAVIFHFFGDAWSKPNKFSYETLDLLVMHESAHFWNGATYQADEEETGPWLAEGGADYLAQRAHQALTETTKASATRTIEGMLNDCVEKLGDKKMQIARGASTYVCGAVLQWLADQAAKTRPHGRDDIFSIWRQIFARAEQNGGLYTGADFISLATANDADARRVFDRFWAEEGRARWAGLPPLLDRIGIRAKEVPPPPDKIRGDTVMHVLNQLCGAGSRGFWWEDTYLKLDTGTRCGPLSGDPIVDAVEGHNLFSDVDAAHAAVDDACKRNGTVTFSSATSGGRWTAPCTKPMPPLPTTFQIVDAGF